MLFKNHDFRSILTFSEWWFLEDWAYVRKNFTLKGKIAWIFMVLCYYVFNIAMWSFIVYYSLYYGKWWPFIWVADFD